MSNQIHPTVVIGEGVELGDGNVVGPYSVIYGPTVIGDGNWIGPQVSIGGPPEHRGAHHAVCWQGETVGAGVRIGGHNVIREFTTINQGYQATTTLADRCYLMGRAHVGHDAVIGDDVTIADSAQIGGHCEVWAWANLGLGAVVHQRVCVGPGAMVGMAAAVRREVAAFAVVVGVPARTIGVNTVGLSRRGCQEPVIAALEQYLRGDGPLPDGVPQAVVADLTRWSHRHSAQPTTANIFTP